MSRARKYTDQQREAMYVLWRRGARGADISRRMAVGTAGVESFEIPRRTVHEICSRMDLERGAPRPMSFEDALDPRRVIAHPEACERILDTVLTRLEAKAHSDGLNLRELDQLAKAATIAFEIERQMRRRYAGPAVQTVPCHRKPKSELAKRLDRAKRQPVEPVPTDLPPNPDA